MESQTLRRRIFGVSSHVLLILIIFILPDLVMAMMPQRHGPAINTGLYIKTAVYIASFYINYFFIINKTLVRSVSSRQILKFILWNILLIAVALIICHLAWKYQHPRRHPDAFTDIHSLLRALSFLMRDAVMIILSIGLAVALRLSSKWQDIQRQKQELIAAQRDSELASLKSQLNPHFLFNTLNTIYALIAIDSEKAQKAVHQLSALLRYTLYDDSQRVELKKECEFIENYVALMRMRVAGHPITMEIDTGTHADAMIPSLLFIPLVENAFKYGTKTPDSTPVEIFIKADADSLTCVTRNSFITGENPDEEKRRSSGIGLANLRRRLTLIYGGKGTLSTSVNGNIFSSRLTIPL